MNTDVCYEYSKIWWIQFLYDHENNTVASMHYNEYSSMNSTLVSYFHYFLNDDVVKKIHTKYMNIHHPSWECIINAAL